MVILRKMAHFGVLGHLYFYNIYVQFITLWKMIIRILIEIVLNLEINLRRIVILITLSF